MSIQNDVIEAIGDGIPVRELRAKLQNCTLNEMRCAVDALMRARRLRIDSDIYTVVPASRPLGTLSPARKAVAESAKQTLNAVEFHSAQRKTPLNNSSGVDNDTRHVGLTAPRQHGACVGEASEGELPLAGCNSPPAVASLDTSASPHPKPAVIGTAAPGSQADPAITRARAQRQVAINQITMLEVDIANQRARLARLEQFIEMHDWLVRTDGQ